MTEPATDTSEREGVAAGVLVSVPAAVARPSSPSPAPAFQSRPRGENCPLPAIPPAMRRKPPDTEEKPRRGDDDDVDGTITGPLLVALLLALLPAGGVEEAATDAAEAAADAGLAPPSLFVDLRASPGFTAADTTAVPCEVAVPAATGVVFARSSEPSGGGEGAARGRGARAMKPRPVVTVGAVVAATGPSVSGPISSEKGEWGMVPIVAAAGAGGAAASSSSPRMINSEDADRVGSTSCTIIGDACTIVADTSCPSC